MQFSNNLVGAWLPRFDDTLYHLDIVSTGVRIKAENSVSGETYFISNIRRDRDSICFDEIVPCSREKRHHCFKFEADRGDVMNHDWKLVDYWQRRRDGAIEVAHAEKTPSSSHGNADCSVPDSILQDFLIGTWSHCKSSVEFNISRVDSDFCVKAFDQRDGEKLRIQGVHWQGNGLEFVAITPSNGYSIRSFLRPLIETEILVEHTMFYADHVHRFNSQMGR